VENYDVNEHPAFVPKGMQLESRVQQLLFNQGYFAARNIFIPGHSQASGAATPDIDVIGYSFTEDSLLKKVIYDCKSGKSQAVNRILWLETMARRIRADRAYIVRANTPQDIKLYGLAEGVYFIGFEMLSRMENNYMGNPPIIIGSTGQEFLAASAELRSAVKNRDVGQALRLVHTNFWFTPSCTAIKQVIAQYERICPINILPGLSTMALQWLKATLVNLFLLAILRICGDVITLAPREREGVLRKRLVSDKIPYAEFTSLVRTTFEYAHSVYGKQESIDPRNLYEIPPPVYTDSLLDLVDRTLKRPREAILIPRFSECVLFENVLLGKAIDTTRIEELFGRPYQDLQSHYRDYLFFLSRICPDTKGFLKILFPPETS